jgi:hypothetical protein
LGDEEHPTKVIRLNNITLKIFIYLPCKNSSVFRGETVKIGKFECQKAQHVAN